MGSRHERIEIAVDDTLKHEIEADAPLVLARRGQRWQAVRLRTGIEHLFVALLSLAGVFVLGWPAEPMLVFVVLSLWAGLAFDVARWLGSPGTVEDHLHYERVDERFWRGVDAWRSNAPSFSMPAQEREDGAALHLLIAVFCAIGFTVAMTIDLGRAADVNLMMLMASRPDMLLLMGLSLCVQYGLRIADFRRPPSTPEDIAAMSFMPFAEAAVFMLMFIFWMASGTLYVQVADILGLSSPRTSLITLFVVCAYVVMLMRGLGEIREVRDARRRIAWLHDTLPSP